MMKKSIAKYVLSSILVSAVSIGSAIAREPFTKQELEQQNVARLKLVEEGYNLWHGSNPTMQANGLACGNCHPDAAASNPQTFPKWNSSMNRVVTWQQMSNWCIQNPQAGKALNPDGDEMLAMLAYAFELHRGKPVAPGLAAVQTKPVAVRYGKGFPSKPSGIGFDTK
jgi:thiosulfate dehydrogenase